MLGLESDGELTDVTCYVNVTGEHAESGDALLYGG